MERPWVTMDFLESQTNDGANVLPPSFTVVIPLRPSYHCLTQFELRCNCRNLSLRLTFFQVNCINGRVWDRSFSQALWSSIQWQRVYSYRLSTSSRSWSYTIVPHQHHVILFLMPTRPSALTIHQHQGIALQSRFLKEERIKNSRRSVVVAKRKPSRRR